ncbi:PAS domain S-box protein [Halobacterium wangiae]|uniref:PAS domain S-box protein n=1 Tax=Halobacterium wangiae TaxID=2902623 RepID=UPI001E62C143|nr:PAS domain S-box protein [Halobacterium wangiae]
MDASATELDRRARQQAVVAELGQQALETDDVAQLLHDAAAVVAEILDIDYSAVLELLPEGEEALLRAGAGWRDDLVGSAAVAADPDSATGYALHGDGTAVVADLSADERFSGSGLLDDHDVVSGVSVVVGPPDDPWGVLGAYATDHREFSEHDVNFLQGVANVLGAAIENERTERERVERDVEEIYGRISDAFYALDEEWRFTYLNDRAHELINPEGRTLVGERIWEAFPEAASRQFAEQYERAMSDQETVSFEAYYPEPLDAWFEVRAYPSETGLSVYFRDVTERREYERQLAESEQRYRTLAEHFPNGIVTLFDRELRYTLAAGQVFDDLPVARGELEGSGPWDVWGSDVAEDLVPLMESALDGEEGAVELSYADREWLVHVVPVADDHGEVFAGMTMAQDTTEQAERERRLQRYETIVETVNDGVYVVDENGDFSMVNQAYASMLGYSPAELVGTAASSVVVDDEVVERVEEQRQGLLEGTIEPSTIEAELRTASGDTVLTEATFAPLEADGESGWYRVGVVRDITERRARERRLAESERRYRALVENFPNGAVGLFDADLRYTAVGGELMDDLDVDPEDRLGATIRELHPDELADRLEPRFRAALDGETRSFELELHGRHLLVNTHPIESGDSFTGMVVVQDVTERREVQRELQESEAKLRMLAENVDEVVWMATADVEEFVYVNPAFEDLWGMDRERLYEDPMAFLEAVHRADRDRVRERFEALPSEPFDGEYRIVRPDGELRWVHAQGARVGDEDGEMTRIVGTAQDVTERKEHEQELERRARQQQVVADLGQFALETDDLDELMDEAARQVADVLDTDYCKVLDLQAGADELLLRQGAGWREGVVGSTTVSAVERDSQASYTLLSDEPVVVEDLETEHRFSGPDLLTSHDVRSGISTIVGSVDDPWGILGTHDTEPRVFTEEDVNFVQTVANVLAEAVKRERYQSDLESLVENLEESNERLEQFAYAASHDLQEPLRMVSSYLQLVETRYGDDLDDDGREFIDFAVDGADRMRTMIEGLLEYSRVDSRGNPLEPVALDSVFADVLDDLQVRIEEADAEIVHEPLPVVDGDAGQLRQLFQNLLDNAIEYSGEAPPSVEVTAERETDAWRISVHDEGIGIAPADAQRVFDVFQRLHSQAEHAGTGIGLALAERIVERHGGEIWVESTPGEGTTFSFTLPSEGSHSR